ncbi:ABC transporter ATP-binding protein [Phycisphaera mikurensis]|uniref:Putative ABC transporter ATP-binding protein n=1 Tax=Phycisphaera mikurensis (strain NBRC 102666 / KCTC 22515 / FYK2301M01) TaxID=1142394 RepID=I0IDR4_PHYMF|nr:ABC transporter ATP-binding protein [Phycisphaera mikurensis]MBB6441216.1 ABC-type lipoprotein export system ATPase subunit [Phycisphaera mikurensis]BAM03402.1 putative ABC transporter ATP-binding protein [Phycisphaera mikurensis NBRC 102666]
MSDAAPPTAGLLVAKAVSRTFREGGRDLRVLDGLGLAVDAGDCLAILGRSGSGKSTLLHLLAGLDRPDPTAAGTPAGGGLFFRGENVYGGSERRLDRYRRSSIGLVFQSYHLIGELSALQNVLLAARVATPLTRWPSTRREAKARAADLLGRVGLGDRLHHRPGKLSGGERQRVAIARALVNEPAILLADEPTGNLDATTGREVLDLFLGLHRAGQTLVLVTHDDKVARAAERVVVLEGGRLVEETAAARGVLVPGKRGRDADRRA